MSLLGLQGHPSLEYSLYIFPIIKTKTLSINCYKNVLALSIAMIVILGLDNLSYINYANNLLKYSVPTMIYRLGILWISITRIMWTIGKCPFVPFTLKTNYKSFIIY